ncbi:hypothetical protein CROQUDRAFT_95072 [Cronartium quercuum f. sp. fusiforme G11]|uniref:Uncharacterized protein n=1 Tax=Cronartium quercuum f. sp. fusiforme G11 TaxID=708437 RepID=A0A9P6TB85_9BASI|nr:hypothetical protein CROQUDRAFT_95072 [Cronartium quercuum f. sp. fusiforme G11]
MTPLKVLKTRKWLQHSFFATWNPTPVSLPSEALARVKAGRRLNVSGWQAADQPVNFPDTTSGTDRISRGWFIKPAPHSSWSIAPVWLSLSVNEVWPGSLKTHRSPGSDWRGARQWKWRRERRPLTTAASHPPRRRVRRPHGPRRRAERDRTLKVLN